MGHVPAGPLPQAGSGADVPRRQHRRGGAPRARDARRLGALGEDLGAAFLARRGGRILARNLAVGGDEVDLVVRFGTVTAVVEVKSRRGADPSAEFTGAQARYLRRAAGALGAGRCDLVTVRFGRNGAGIRWLPGVC